MSSSGIWRRVEVGMRRDTEGTPRQNPSFLGVVLLTFVLSVTGTAVADIGTGLQDLNDAARAGNVEEVKRLLAPEEGTQLVEADTHNVVMRTAILTAKKHEAESKQIVELLLARGADIDLRDEHGSAPLHHAASLNDREMVGLLLSHHADFRGHDSQGFAPPRLATSEDVLELFAQAGAPPESLSPTAEDLSACEAVVRERLWKGSPASDEDLWSVPKDPRDYWIYGNDSLNSQGTMERRVRIRGRDYILAVWVGQAHVVVLDDFQPDEIGPRTAPPLEAQARIDYALKHHKTRKGPVYLARIGTDGVAGMVCEFWSRPNSLFPGIRRMTPLERLESRSNRQHIGLGQAAARGAGLWGARALLAAVHKDPSIMSRWPEGYDGLPDDAGIDADAEGRDDMVRFYNEYGIM